MQATTLRALWMATLDVFINLVHAFDNDFAVFSVHGPYGATSSLIVASNHFNYVTLANVHLNNSENTQLL
mgnify:CR=1 FL=1